MKLNSVDLDVKAIGREIEHFLSVTSRVYWEKLIKKVDTSGGIFYKEYLLRKNPFTEGFRQYFHLHSEGKSIWKNRTAEIDYIAGKIFIINKIIRNVNARGQAQIIGRLRGGDIRSFLQEITIATHFLRNGFEVNFIEYERPESEGRTFDFLVSRDSIEAEVECKSKSYDAGRKIKRDGFYILCDELYRQFKSTRMKCLLKINCSKNLGQNHEIFIGLAKKIKVAIGDGDKNIIFGDNFSIAIDYLAPETLIDSEEKLASVIRPYRTPKSHFATVSNNEMTIVIKVESEEKDTVLKAMYDELKSSLDQFSKTRPAIIACYIEGIYPEQWEDLKGENGLAAMTTYLLKREKADHIHTVGYSSEVEMIRTGNVVEYINPVLFFKNENGRYYKSQDIFSFKTDNYKPPLP